MERNIELELCDCMKILRENFKGIEEVRAKKHGEELMKRMKRIEMAASLFQQIWAEMK